MKAGEVASGIMARASIQHHDATHHGATHGRSTHDGWGRTGWSGVGIELMVRYLSSLPCREPSQGVSAPHCERLARNITRPGPMSRSRAGKRDAGTVATWDLGDVLHHELVLQAGREKGTPRVQLQRMRRVRRTALQLALAAEAMGPRATLLVGSGAAAVA